MPTEHHYRIDYLNQGAYKSFYVRCAKMDNAEAWHWATVDAGVGELPKYRSDRIIKLSKPKAERLGITEVTWSPA